MLDTVEMRIVENSEKNTTKRLLYCLLRIISTSEKSQATKACERLLTYMKKIDLIFETFKPTTKLIQQLNFNRLLVSGDNEVVYDLMIFVLRYYPEVTYEFFLMGNTGLQKLKREEVKRVWDTVHSVIKKMDILKGDMRSRSVIIFPFGFLSYLLLGSLSFVNLLLLIFFCVAIDRKGSWRNIFLSRESQKSCESRRGYPPT